jgi:ABC-type amino acid transport substrate-binding protein
MDGRLIRVAVDSGNPPFTQQQGDEIRGFSVEMLQAIYGYEGMDVECVPEAGLAPQLMRLSYGAVDAVLDITITSRRRSLYAFSEHYYLDHLGIMSSGRDWLGTSLNHFRGRATVKAYSYAEEWLRHHHPTLPIELVGSTDEQLECVQDGRAAALIAGHDTIAALEAAGSTYGLSERGASFAPAGLALATLPDDVERIIVPFNEGLRALIRAGDWERLRQKWFARLS